MRVAIMVMFFWGTLAVLVATATQLVNRKRLRRDVEAVEAEQAQSHFKAITDPMDELRYFENGELTFFGETELWSTKVDKILNPPRLRGLCSHEETTEVYSAGCLLPQVFCVGCGLKRWEQS